MVDFFYLSSKRALIKKFSRKASTKIVLPDRNLIFFGSRIKKIIKGFSEQNLNSSADIYIKSLSFIVSRIFSP